MQIAVQVIEATQIPEYPKTLGATTSLFRRGKAPVETSPPAPMPMVSFSGKKALHFTGNNSAAERDVDLAILMHARDHVVRAGAAEAATELRKYLRIVYATEMMAGPRQDKLRFAWRDSVVDAAAASGSKTKKKADKAPAVARDQEHSSLETEWSVALFTLAAELARAAAAEDRRGPDGIRRACGALCDAAGALRAAAAKTRGLSGAQGMCYMTQPCLAAFETLMLAQALECYFELAVAGGKLPALCSKIARQVSLDYHEVSVKLGSLEQQQPNDKSWVPLAQAKAVYFQVEASLQRARSLRELGPGSMGEAVARLRAAASVLKGAHGKTGPLSKKSPRASSTAAVRDAAARLQREVDTELAAAEKDNSQVYFERVLAADMLAELPGLAEPLVRPTAGEKVLREADGEPSLAAASGAPMTTTQR